MISIILDCYFIIKAGDLITYTSSIVRIYFIAIIITIVIVNVIAIFITIGKRVGIEINLNSTSRDSCCLEDSSLS